MALKAITARQPRRWGRDAVLRLRRASLTLVPKPPRCYGRGSASRWRYPRATSGGRFRPATSACRARCEEGPAFVGSCVEGCGDVSPALAWRRCSSLAVAWPPPRRCGLGPGDLAGVDELQSPVAAAIAAGLPADPGQPVSIADSAPPAPAERRRCCVGWRSAELTTIPVVHAAERRVLLGDVAEQASRCQWKAAP